MVKVVVTVKAKVVTWTPHQGLMSAKRAILWALFFSILPPIFPAPYNPMQGLIRYLWLLVVIIMVCLPFLYLLHYIYLPRLPFGELLLVDFLPLKEIPAMKESHPNGHTECSTKCSNTSIAEVIRWDVPTSDWGENHTSQNNYDSQQYHCLQITSR